ncbi:MULTISPECIES: hypothetical protein [unclassified Endozoicomonas]|uniref:hypothetical protein n=1 Tax=unclassified Endozoicomonas TaxID=2644528 RepID=UPI003BB68875
MSDYYPTYRRFPDFFSFKSRLEYVLGGRRLYPWASAIGVSKGAAEKMQKDVVPGSEILRVVHLREGVELTWLVTGSGRPFCINTALDTDDLNKMVNLNLLKNLNKSIVHLCHDGLQIVVAVGTRSSYIYKENTIKYRRWEMYSGRFSRKLAETLIYHFSSDEADSKENGWFCSHIPSDKLTSIIRGEQGALHLFGDNDKLKPSLQIQPIDDMELMLGSLLSQLSEQRSSSNEKNIYGDLLKQVMICVDDYCREDSIHLDIDQQAKIYTSIYNHCQRTGESPYSVGLNLLPTLLDIV